MRHACLFPLALLLGCAASDRPASESPAASGAGAVAVQRAFDVPALLGLNANQIIRPLTSPTIRSDQDRTPRQMPTGGGAEASYTYWHDTTALVVRYDPASLRVISYFIRTKSGLARDYRTLLALANVSEHDQRITVEPMASVSHPPLYTGVKLVPRQ